MSYSPGTLVRGVDFGRIWNASGARGFFGEGYWFHPYLKLFGLNFDGSTFVAKTTTFNRRQGNMLLNPDFTPTTIFPNCIKVRPIKGIALNSVGLSGPGATALLDDGRWQDWSLPFQLSFMSVEKERHDRLSELSLFVDALANRIKEFRARVALQLNFSCPNVGLHLAELIEKVWQALNIAAILDIPLIPKLNLLLPVAQGVEISHHPNCDALCISNTIPWLQLRDKINWEKSGEPKNLLLHT